MKQSELKAVRRPGTAMQIILIAFLALTGLSGNVASAEAKQGLFWEVESASGVSWLLGALHFGREDFYPLRENIQKAFSRSDMLVVEMDESRVSQSEQMRIMQETVLYPSGKTLADELSPKTIALLKEELAKLNIPYEAVERYKPGFMLVMLAAVQGEKLGYSPEQGIDSYMLKQARLQGKPVDQIENFEQQMKLLQELPQDDETMRESLEMMDSNEATWRDMESAWRSGDGDKLYQKAIAEVLEEAPELAPLYDKLFFARNEVMAKSVESCLQRQKKCFVTVGAGHLVGPGSVVDYLRKAGFKVTQQ